MSALLSAFQPSRIFRLGFLLLNSKSLSKRFLGFIRTIRARIVSGSKGDFNGISHSGCHQPALDFIKNGQIAKAERRLEEIVSSWTFLIFVSVAPWQHCLPGISTWQIELDVGRLFLHKGLFVTEGKNHSTQTARILWYKTVSG